ncbi:MAG TPA: nitronate monooxygenase family protein [Acidimicrobiales bacterium]|nr:nitronate monooxygenase family protein [Acidimicrobiales bacterium]
MRTDICDTFGIEYPIFAFSHCRDVVAEVSRAGGMGVLGAVGLSPRRLEIALDWIDEHVDGHPYGVDVIMPARSADTGERDLRKQRVDLTSMIPDGHVRFVEEVLDRHGVPPLPDEPRGPGQVLGTGASTFPLLDVALAHPTALVVNALGPPPPEVLESAHAQGVKVGALAGSVQQAVRHRNAGVDLVVAQGTEAGGHTGDVATMVLVPEVVDAVGPLPVLAAGGIGTGRQIAAALALGASGVWTGSLWLTVAESDTSPMVVDKLLAASSRDTVRSRSITGKPVRQLRTAWTEAWDAPDAPQPLTWPLQTMLTGPALARIERARCTELAGTPVGQIVGRMTSVRTARQVMFDLVDEFVDAARRVGDLAGDPTTT